MISLWQCRNAHHPDNIKHFDYVWCAKGHNLGYIPVDSVKQGKPLICRICQSCPDCDIIGDDIPKAERGWE